MRKLDNYWKERFGELAYNILLGMHRNVVDADDAKQMEYIENFLHHFADEILITATSAVEDCIYDNTVGCGVYSPITLDGKK